MANKDTRQVAVNENEAAPTGNVHGIRRNPQATTAPDANYNDRGLLHLGELVPQLRQSLNIDVASLTDHDILESLKAITARADTRARWLGAFNSPLGRWLAVRGSDLNTELNLVLSVLPPARS